MPPSDAPLDDAPLRDVPLDGVPLDGVPRDAVPRDAVPREDARSGTPLGDASRLLEGETLRDLLDREKILAPAHALQIFLPVMRALSAAHAQGIVHRDLTPDDVSLRAEGDRIVATLLQAPKRTGAPRTPAVVGTPAYMAPEQAQGVHDPTPLVDVWAIGVMLYEALSGRLPFEGPPALVLVRVLTEVAPPLAHAWPAAPPSLARAVDQALRPDATGRHASMAAFSEALSSAAFASGIALPPHLRPTRSAGLDARPAQAPASREDPLSSCGPVRGESRLRAHLLSLALLGGLILVGGLLAHLACSGALEAPVPSSHTEDAAARTETASPRRAGLPGRAEP